MLRCARDEGAGRLAPRYFRGGRIFPLAYLTKWLNTLPHVPRPSQPRLRRPGRSHPSRDPRDALAGNALGDGAGGAPRHEPAGDLEAPAGAREQRPDRTRARCAVASVPVAGGADEGSGRLDGAVPPVLGGELRPPRGLFAGTSIQTRGEENPCPPKKVRQQGAVRTSSPSAASSTRPVPSSSRRGRNRSTSNTG